MILVTEISISIWVWHDWNLILWIQAQNPDNSHFWISPLFPVPENSDEMVGWNFLGVTYDIWGKQNKTQQQYCLSDTENFTVRYRKLMFWGLKLKLFSSHFVTFGALITLPYICVFFLFFSTLLPPIPLTPYLWFSSAEAEAEDGVKGSFTFML